MCKKVLKVGIFGGGFDPIHDAHLSLGEKVTSELHLDRLIWVPTGVAWHKQRTLSDAAHRINMLKLAFESIPLQISQKWVIDRCEVDRQGDSYTIDTVNFLQSAYSLNEQIQWYMVIGADQFNSIHHWKDWLELLQRITLVVFQRMGVAFHVNSKVLNEANYMELDIQASDLSSSFIRKMIHTLVCACPQTSHRTIINQLSKFVPSLVAQYIVEQGLYINEL